MIGSTEIRLQPYSAVLLVPKSETFVLFIISGLLHLHTTFNLILAVTPYVPINVSVCQSNSDLYLSIINIANSASRAHVFRLAL